MIKSKFLLIAVVCFITTVVFSQDIDTIQQKIDYYISQAQLETAKIYIQSHLNQGTKKSDLNYQLVKVLFMQSSYNESLKLAFKSLDTIDDPQQSIKFNFMIGCIYSAISDYSKSIEYFDLVVDHNQDTSLTVQTHLLLSQLHLELSDSTRAGKSLAEAYQLTRNSNASGQVKNHVAMQFNFFNKNYELCKLQNLKIIKDSTSFLNAKSYAYSMIGDCLIQQDSLPKAATYYDDFLRLTIETKDPEQIKVAANKLIVVYEKMGDQEMANAYHKIYNRAVSDSLSFSVEKYRDLYEVEKSRDLKILRSTNLRKHLFIGSILLLVISLGLFYYFKGKSEKQKTLAATKKVSVKKIVISEQETAKIALAIDQLIAQQLFLTPNITRKLFCSQNEIKSERYLSHFINEKFKKSFSVFISDLRIEHAYARIKNDSTFRNYKIEVIAKECGFGSKKSFERVFLAKYQETPYKLILRLNN